MEEKMTRKLEDLLNLPENKTAVGKAIEQAEELEAEQKKYKKQVTKQEQKAYRDFAELDKITTALPAVGGLGEKADEELDEIAAKAMETFEEFRGRGPNVDALLRHNKLL